MGFLSCGEDGSLIVGEGSLIVQNIPHPCSLWCAVAIPSTGSGIEGSTGWTDFVTGGHDGVLRCDEEHKKLYTIGNFSTFSYYLYFCSFRNFIYTYTNELSCLTSILSPTHCFIIFLTSSSLSTSTFIDTFRVAPTLP